MKHKNIYIEGCYLDTTCCVYYNLNHNRLCFGGIKIKCPYCRNNESKVVDKRETTDLTQTRRRRECLSCKKRFTTYERIEDINLIVIKKDGRREQFNREKLKSGIIKALEKRPVETEKIDAMLIDIEERIAKKGKEIPTEYIGELVMKALKKLDKVAYIRFASVYRDFKDVEDFKKAVKEIR